MLYFVALRGGLANNGTGFVLWTRALGLVLFGRAFRGSFFLVVLFVVRAFGRSFRGSCFWVRAFGRSVRGSFFWFVLLGARMCFFVRFFKILRGVCGKVRGFLMQR